MRVPMSVCNCFRTIVPVIPGPPTGCSATLTEWFVSAAWIRPGRVRGTIARSVTRNSFRIQDLLLFVERLSQGVASCPYYSVRQCVTPDVIERSESDPSALDGLQDAPARTA